jgi:hypothetical protein
MDPDKDFLNQVLRTFPVSDGAIHEIQQAPLIALHQLLEGLGSPAEVSGHDARVIQLAKRGRSWGRQEGLDLPLFDHSRHDRTPACLRERLATSPDS